MTPQIPKHQADESNSQPHPGNRHAELLTHAVVALVIIVLWLPTLTSGQGVSRNDDFLLHASRHEAVRKSLIEHHTLPLRSHWFGGGFPTLGEPEDPALNPLVLLTLLFGSIMGLKLIAFLAALVSGLGTYGLARHILGYTRYGAVFSALTVGASLYVPAQMQHGNLPELCLAYLPLCMLLVGLSCRGRRAALFLLPVVLYTMLASGKQGFFMAIFYLGVFCLLDALPMFNNLAPASPAKRYNARALGVLVLALGATFLIGMVRILPALEFISARGGLANMDLPLQAEYGGVVGMRWQALFIVAVGMYGASGFATTDWLPIILLAVGLCRFHKTLLPWLITLVLFTWLAIANETPADLFGLLKGLPIFSTIASPYKYFSFAIVLSIAMGSGQFFWLLPKLPRPWMEHACGIALIAVAVGLLYPMTTSTQRQTYDAELAPGVTIQQDEFFSVKGLELPRKRGEPHFAVTYLNLLQNVGTIDWYTSVPIAENAVPMYFVNAENDTILNPDYRGEVYFVGGASAPERRSREPAPGARRAAATFHPNSITIEVTVPEPDVLVVNQNYHSAWKTDRGELFERGGLIALRLHETGSYAIHLRYLPTSFVVGLTISILSIAGWVLACCKFPTGNMLRAKQSAP